MSTTRPNASQVRDAAEAVFRRMVEELTPNVESEVEATARLHGAVLLAQHPSGNIRLVLVGNSARPRPRLTPRQAEVAELALGGASMKEIASALRVRPSTVETHLRHAYERLGIRSHKDLRFDQIAERRPAAADVEENQIVGGSLDDVHECFKKILNALVAQFGHDLAGGGTDAAKLPGSRNEPLELVEVALRQIRYVVWTLPEPRLEALTPTERMLAPLLALGLSHDTIAGGLGLRGLTVKTHHQAIYRKYGVHSRAELVRRLAEWR